jgi:hypothetical protein
MKHPFVVIAAALVVDIVAIAVTASLAVHGVPSVLEGIGYVLAGGLAGVAPPVPWQAGQPAPPAA